MPLLPKRTRLIGLLCCFTIANAQDAHTKLYWSSAAALIAGSALDYTSSVRLNALAIRGLVREDNALLRNSYGGIAPGRALTWKLGTSTAVLAVEWLVRKRFRNLCRLSTQEIRHLFSVNPICPVFTHGAASSVL